MCKVSELTGTRVERESRALFRAGAGSSGQQWLWWSSFGLGSLLEGGVESVMWGDGWMMGSGGSFMGRGCGVK